MVAAKICGINAPEALAAAIAGGAEYVGFVFYPPSPRSLGPAEARRLAERVPAQIVRVGLFVDADDATLSAILESVPLDMLQLHGAETPERAAEIRRRWARPVMKALAVAGEADIAKAALFAKAVDWLLFDAKPPPGMVNALPGGNALAFDWRLIAGAPIPLPWMLSGGLNADNLSEAVAISGARVVDVSSGIEDRPGRKNPEKIRQFLALAARLPGDGALPLAGKASMC